MATPAQKIHLKVENNKFTAEPNIVAQSVRDMVDFISPTLGPKIRHVLVDMGYKTELMDDGVSIAEEFEFEDEFQNAVASYVKEVSKKTDDKAGDGTTTTMVILAALLEKLMESGKSYPTIRNELEKALPEVVAHIEKETKKVKTKEDLRKVARTSMDDPMADQIADVIWKIGHKGAITITDSLTHDLEVERVEGYVVGRGFINRAMVTDKEKAIHEAPNNDFQGRVAVAVVEKTIGENKDIVPILSAAEDAGVKNLVIFAPNVIGEALATCVVQRLRGAMNILAVQLPGQGEKMKDFVHDIRTVTGALAPMKGFDKDCLGFADAVKATSTDTTVIGGHGDRKDIKALINELQAKADEQKETYDKDYFFRRQARLQDGIVILKVGGRTDTEINLRIKKVEDAVNACKCALEDGVCPGAGMTLLRAENSSQELTEALRSVHETVVRNAEAETAECAVGETVNVLTGKKGDFMEVGVVDATKVVKSAVENAVSVAQILFSTSGIITSKRQDG